VDGVLEKVLRSHEPYPAWVVRHPFTFLRANAGAEALFPGLTQLSPGSSSTCGSGQARSGTGSRTGRR
jgi:MmyB-like transcription regulator ligand binding domain